MHYDDSDDEYDEAMEQEQTSRYARYAELEETLANQRIHFAGVGTNKAKRRLNKLAKTNPIAAAVRIALEIEDKNIVAKQTRGVYREKVYELKSVLIHELSRLCTANNWIWGIQDSDVFGVSHVIYFEIPGCKQISWHFTAEKDITYPIYAGEWDGLENSTLFKLGKTATSILMEAGMLKDATFFKHHKEFKP